MKLGSEMTNEKMQLNSDKTANIGISDAAKIISNIKKPILLLTHTHPDADTLGSASALALILRKMGKKVDVLTDFVPNRYKFLDKNVFVNEPVVDNRTVISVDIAAPKLLGEFEETYSEKIDLAIDHHRGNSILANQKLILADRSACGEIIYELMKELGVELDKDIAESLYAAISSDTGGFRFSSVKPRTHRIAAELLETGIDFAEINRLLFDTKSKEQFELSKLAYSILERYADGKIALIPFTLDVLSKAGIDPQKTEFGEIAQLPRQLEGVEVGIVIRPESTVSAYKLSLRSNRYVNVSEICSIFGGGGHFHAAGCTIAGTVEEIKAAILREVEKKL